MRHRSAMVAAARLRLILVGILLTPIVTTYSNNIPLPTKATWPSGGSAAPHGPTALDTGSGPRTHRREDDVSSDAFGIVGEVVSSQKHATDDLGRGGLLIGRDSTDEGRLLFGKELYDDESEDEEDVVGVGLDESSEDGEEGGEPHNGDGNRGDHGDGEDDERCVPIEECRLCRKSTPRGCSPTGRRRKYECNKEDNSKYNYYVTYFPCDRTVADEEYLVIRMQTICLFLGSLGMASVVRQKRLHSSLFDQRARGQRGRGRYAVVGAVGSNPSGSSTHAGGGGASGSATVESSSGGTGPSPDGSTKGQSLEMV